MNDRALLEAAARAAGINPRIVGAEPGIYWLDDEKRSSPQWNALTDDGDEARLEAALNLEVMWRPAQVCVHYSWELFADHGGDKQAARRRAGVRAAAAIGSESG